MIRAGRDIWAVGEVIQTPYGAVRITAKRDRHDYVDYAVEQAHPVVFSPWLAPTRWSRFMDWLWHVVSRQDS